jgi:hypothetical protein
MAKSAYRMLHAGARPFQGHNLKWKTWASLKIKIFYGYHLDDNTRLVIARDNMVLKLVANVFFVIRLRKQSITTLGGLVPDPLDNPKQLSSASSIHSMLVETTSWLVHQQQACRHGLAIRVGLMGDLEGRQYTMLLRGLTTTFELLQVIQAEAE